MFWVGNMIGDGRRGEDPRLHKGDWGSHSGADREAENMEPTQDQLEYIQALIKTNLPVLDHQETNQEIVRGQIREFILYQRFV